MSIWKRKRAKAVETIISVLSEYSGISSARIMSTQRTSAVAHWRAVAAYIAHEHFSCSLTEVGVALSRDHTTVLHSVRKIAKMRARDEEAKSELDTLVALCLDKAGWMDGDNFVNALAAFNVLDARQRQKFLAEIASGVAE